jgi:hypothetical protein
MQHFAISWFWVGHARRVLVAASRRHERSEEVSAFEIVLSPESTVEGSLHSRNASAIARRRWRGPSE